MTTHPKSKSKGGGLFPAQFPGRARRSIFKVFSSIYWETFKQPTTYKIQTKNEEAGRQSRTDPNIRRQPAPAVGSDTGPDPELSPSWKKKNSKQANLTKTLCVFRTKLCVDKDEK